MKRLDKERLGDALWSMRVSLLRVAGSIVCTSQNAEDAVSTAMIRAYQCVEELRDDRNLRPWMMKITVHCCYDQLRIAHREQSAEDVNVFDTPIFQPNDTLYETLLELSPPVRQVLTLYYYEGFSTAEIATILGLARPTVSMRLSRGRSQLKAILEGATADE